jgi:hypothetical protein
MKTLELDLISLLWWLTTTKERHRKMANRSTNSGRYVSNATAARWPQYTVAETGANSNSSGTRFRDASSGLYVTPQYAANNPRTTQSETD